MMETKSKEDVLNEVLGPIRKKMHSELQMQEIELAMERFSNQENRELVEAFESLLKELDKESPGSILTLDWALVTQAKAILEKHKK